MAIMTMTQNTRKATRESTPLEQEHARLIGALMVCAKLLQQATLNEATGRYQDTIRDLTHLLVSLGGLYEGDGARMESEALRLAAMLGFHVEQHFISSAAGGVH